MSHHYEPEFKKKIVRLHLEDGKSIKSLAAEYGVSHASISNWTAQFRTECQTNEEAQYTSKEFTEFCEELGITQSMSKAGYPYDNAPMERYFNTLKTELFSFH